MRRYDVLIGTEMLQLCNKVWLIVYTEVTFNTKVPLVPKGGVRYREVSAIFVRYKEFFLWDYDRDSIRYREMSAITHVRYEEVLLYLCYFHDTEYIPSR